MSFQDVITDYRCYPRIFLVENWLSTFFKNNIYSEKNSTSKYMLKLTKDMLEQGVNYFQSYQENRTMSLTSDVLTTNF